MAHNQSWIQSALVVMYNYLTFPPLVTLPTGSPPWRKTMGRQFGLRTILPGLLAAISTIGLAHAFGEVAKGAGLSLQETGFFSRTAGVIPKIGPVKDAGSLLAPLTEKNPLSKEALQTKEGYFIVRLSTVEPADQNRFSEAKKTLDQRLANLKQEEFFQNWLSQLKSKAKIDINKDIFKS